MVVECNKRAYGGMESIPFIATNYSNTKDGELNGIIDLIIC